MSPVVRELKESDRAELVERIFALEKGVTYPLGDDRFEIDHGDDYFAFFDRLGDTSYFVVLDGQRIVAVACGILHSVPPRAGEKPQSVWYGCDLKVHPDYRRRRLPWAIFKHAFPRKYPICGRGYGITMNPGDGSKNRVVQLVERFGLAPISVGATLALYSLSADEMASIRTLLETERGPIGYLSLAGIKDIVLESTGAPMPLLHVQFGPRSETDRSGRRGHWHSEPQTGHVHMFCTPTDDSLHASMKERGFTPSATATVIQHRMGSWDWRFVLTSEI